MKVKGALPRYTPPVVDEVLCVEASAGAPCPCCGAAAACTLLAGEEFVRCRAVVSRWPVAGGGWLHRVGELAVPAGRDAALATAS
jgi:hypothetical protein